jgi:hypothetical protein
VADGGWLAAAGWRLARGSAGATYGVPVIVADPVRHINAALGHMIAYFARKIRAQWNFLGTITYLIFRIAQSFQDLFEL